MSAAIAPNPNDPQAPLGMPARPWWIGYIRQLHLDIPLAVESGGTGKNTPLDASDIAETSALKILTATERTKLAGLADALAACRPKHQYSYISTASTAIAAERGNTYGVNANGCTLTLPTTGTTGYVDGDEICVVLGVSAARELAIVSPSYILRGTGLQPVNTPFNISGHGTFITFTKISTAWGMSYPEYALSRLTEGTPSGPTATGTKGMARFDADYIYVCTDTNTWVRFAKDGAWT